jgi:hypothetical protein
LFRLARPPTRTPERGGGARPPTRTVCDTHLELVDESRSTSLRTLQSRLVAKAALPISSSYMSRAALAPAYLQQAARPRHVKRDEQPVQSESSRDRVFESSSSLPALGAHHRRRVPSAPSYDSPSVHTPPPPCAQGAVDALGCAKDAMDTQHSAACNSLSAADGTTSALSAGLLRGRRDLKSVVKLRCKSAHIAPLLRGGSVAAHASQPQPIAAHAH